jgi:hypothetical protein
VKGYIPEGFRVLGKARGPTRRAFVKDEEGLSLRNTVVRAAPRNFGQTNE